MNADKDQVCAEMQQQFAALTIVEFEELKERWRKEFSQSGKKDSGCGHGLIRFPYDRAFTPCHCGQVLGCGKKTMFEKLLASLGLQKIPKHEPLGPSAFAALRARHYKELEELDSLGGGSSQNLPREVVFCGTTKACPDV